MAPPDRATQAGATQASPRAAPRKLPVDGESDGSSEFAEPVPELPEAGQEFQGFRLLEELGRGAFARVFLAEQPLLAHRKVALKIAASGAQESQTLAELQHTHIVPIYSLHRSGRLHAVCMPYFGSTTLADVLHDLASRPTMPNSAQELLSTLRERSRKAPLTATSAVFLPPTTDAEPAVVSVRRIEKVSPLVHEVQGRSYVEAVLWLGRCLADGLAHAHARGIIHRDLKPANVLITDDGQPMLLDFNLSENTRLRGDASRAMLGGTLPYMAPEHLDAFRGGTRQVDARSDLYSLGILLFELLTGQAPFQKGRRGKLPGDQPHKLIEEMIAERRQASPAIRRLNLAVTPAMEAIVLRCLEPDPARRYQTARQLQEDLQRQIDSRPLAYVPEPSRREWARKWLRRHPRFLWRLAACGAAAALAVAVTFGVQSARHARAEHALLCLENFDTETQTVRTLLGAQADDPALRDRAMRLGLASLESYDVLNDEAWKERQRVLALPARERSRLQDDMGDLLLLLARAQAWPVAIVPGEAQERSAPLRQALALNRHAERCYPADAAPAALWFQRADLLRQLGDTNAAQQLRDRASQTIPQSAHDHFLLAREHLGAGRTGEAAESLRRSTELDPRQYWSWFYLGNCRDELSDDVRATVCYSMCVALDAKAYAAVFNRGLAHLRQKQFASALTDFDRAAALRPELADPYLNRSLARQGLQQYRAAVDDLSIALEKDGAPTRIYFMRARARDRAGDRAGAERDRAQGLSLRPTDEKSWIARGMARLAKDAAGALADFEQALELNPRSRAALQNKAHVLAEKLGRTAEAIGVLDQAITLFPDYYPARVGRGVLFARQGRRDEALTDADQVLKADPPPVARYQVACIYALTSKNNAQDQTKAMQRLAESLRQGFGIDLLTQDHDLDPLRSLPEFQQLARAAQAWQEALRPRPSAPRP